MSQCFFCEGKVSNPVAYLPCVKCKEVMSRGVSMIEVDSLAKTKNPEIAGRLAPTGRWFVMAEQRFKEVAVILGLADNHVVPILANGYMLTEPAVYERFRPQDHVEKPLTYRHKKRNR